jgi:CheY-like chemotaxis protein
MSIERKRKALVVDDEVLVALTLGDMLEDLGFEVLGPVARIEDALELLAGGRQIDLALLDINLAGTRSWPVARELKRLGISFAFVSGYEATQAEVPEDLRAFEVCPKPVDFERLRSCIAEMQGTYGQPEPDGNPPPGAPRDQAPD